MSGRSSQKDSTHARHRSNSKAIRDREPYPISSRVDSPEKFNDPREKFAPNETSHFSTYNEYPLHKPFTDHPKHKRKYGPRYGYASRADEWGSLFLEAVERIPDFLRSRRLRRYAIMWLFLIGITVTSWKLYLGPKWYEERSLTFSLTEINRMRAGGTFGLNQRPTFQDMIHMKELDEKYLPRSTNSKEKTPGRSRRLVFVGDVHGCKDELDQLLAEAKFDHTTDHLVLLGDMVSRGPDSLAVVDLASSLGASCVRGNHEDRILLVHKDLQSTLVPLNGSNEPESLSALSKAEGNPEEEASSYGDSSDRHLAQQLSAKQHKYLTSCPVILKIGAIGPLGEVVAVHGGLVPGLSLDHQDPFTVMSMKSIDLLTHVPSREAVKEGARKKADNNAQTRSLVPWTKLWNKYQRMLPNPSRKRRNGGKKPEPHSTVIYGHDSKKGLQLKAWTKGLDSGCVRGGRLTALIVSDGGHLETVSVPCKDYTPKKALRAKVDDVLRD